jgi:hypothetical protein
VSPAIATTYYVDPATGNNANTGTATATPWKNPPGTVLIDNSGYYSASWGAITTSNKIKCGDTILLKGGSTQTSAQGGGWAIRNGDHGNGAGYYTATCTAAAPITIRVATAAEWTGSNGNFTFNAAGITWPPCLFGSFIVGNCGGDPDNYLIGIDNIGAVVFGGNSTSQRFVLAGAKVDANGINTNGGTQSSGSCAYGTKSDDVVQYVEVHDVGRNGTTAGCVTNTAVRHALIHANGDGGTSTGYSSDHYTSIVFNDVESYNNNLNTTTSYSTLGAGMFFLGCQHCYVVNSYVHDNYDRGINHGEVGSQQEYDVLVRDSVFVHNGLSTDNSGLYAAGICSSGDDNQTNGNEQRMIMERNIVYRNRKAGAPCAYGSGWADVWNSVFYNNGYDTSISGTNDISYSIDNNGLYVENSIVQKARAGSSVWDEAPHGSDPRHCPHSNYNLYRPFSANSETLMTDNSTVCGGATVKTFASPGTTGSPFGANDKIGTAFPINFVALDPNVYANNDFHVTSGSAAIDAGTCMFFAGSAGSGTTIGSLTPGGGAIDPRLYFIQPSSYKDAVGDLINIGSTRVTITSMTATSISFTPAATWAKGACVHLPYNGAAPDMGVYEFGTTGPPGQIAPPQLLSVDPIP